MRALGHVRGAPPRRNPSESQLKQYVLGEDIACPECNKSVRKSDGPGYKCPKCRLDVGGWLINRAQEEHGNLNRKPHPATSEEESQGKFSQSKQN